MRYNKTIEKVNPRTANAGFMSHKDDLMTTSEYITIPLTKGYVTTVDAIDSDLASFNWYAHITPSGRVYARRSQKHEGKMLRIYLHKVILARKLYPLILTQLGDHIDNNSLNNSRSNLREATHSQNLMNSRKQNKTIMKGATFHKRDKRWRAQITFGGKNVHLGYFDTAEEAHIAYCEASKKYHGEYGRTE